MATTAEEPRRDPPLWRRFGGWLAALLAAIIAPLAVVHFTESTATSLRVGRPTYEPMTRRDYLHDVMHESAPTLPARFLRAKGVRLIANIQAVGYDGRVLGATCELYDVQAHRALPAEQLRLHVAKSPYLDPPCWRPLRAGRVYKGSITVSTPDGGERPSPPVTLHW